MLIELTSSELMALKDLLLDYILNHPKKIEVFIDIVNQKEITPEELLKVLTKQEPV